MSVAYKVIWGCVNFEIIVGSTERILTTISWFFWCYTLWDDIFERRWGKILHTTVSYPDTSALSKKPSLFSQGQDLAWSLSSHKSQKWVYNSVPGDKYLKQIPCFPLYSHFIPFSSALAVNHSLVNQFMQITPSDHPLYKLIKFSCVSTWAQGGMGPPLNIALGEFLICCFCRHHIDIIISSSFSHQMIRDHHRNEYISLNFIVINPLGLNCEERKELNLPHLCSPTNLPHLYSVWHVEGI